MTATDSRDLAFAQIQLPHRNGKPRDTALTMMIEWGIPLGAQADWLDLVAPYVDLAKVAVGISGLLPLETLRAKVELYQRHDVEPFPGGMYLEYAFAKGLDSEYFAACRDAGYRLIEVSDNAIPLNRSDKDRLISTARDQGFRVLGEVGSKHAKTPVPDLVADFKACMAAGCWKVFVEAAELVDGGVLRTELLDALAREVAPADAIWELPGTWIGDVHHHEVHSLETWLVEHLGLDVNIANVPPDGVMTLETHRRQIGVRMLADHLT